MKENIKYAYSCLDTHGNVLQMAFTQGSCEITLAKYKTSILFNLSIFSFGEFLESCFFAVLALVDPACCVRTCPIL